MSDPTLFPHGEPPAAAQPLDRVVNELRRRMAADKDDPLFKIGVMAMTAQSDPHATAAVYRQALINICSFALEAQESKRLLAVAPAAALSPTPEHFCATCHHRWTGEGAAEHCGYCHRVLVAALQSAALSPTQCCVGCGFTGPLIGFTFEKKPGPFCANCWKALRGMFEWLATDEVSRGASAALSPSEEPKK